ncbi:hypothetical protein, partial [Allorhizocola rhizosphaerae]|uniref:hypothetical protein n=1 Tax=Allorhizocola rhizosphaerae TaxID=1872709 RepID=UPI0013C2A2BE
RRRPPSTRRRPPSTRRPRLVETFSPFLDSAPDVRERVGQSIVDIVGGGLVRLDVRTTLVLARKA